MKVHRRLALLAPLLLAACTAGPDYARPGPPASRALDQGRFLRTDQAEIAMPAARWWDTLGDPQLTALVDKGMRGAPSIAAATARLRQARAGLAGKRAALLPTVGASMLYAKGDLPDNSLGGTSGDISLFNLGVDAQWEVDLWGAKRRDVERTQAQAEASQARLADAQVSLAAEIARSYVALRAREASQALLGERRTLDARILAIANDRFAGGTASRLAIETAAQAAEKTQADQAAAAAEIAVLHDQIAVLTGEAPGTLDAMPRGEIPMPPASVAVGDPAAMLARRPDVRAAERDLAAQSAQIGIRSGARRFPQVSLLGLIGIGGTSASDLFDTSQLSMIALPRLSWNFLDFGRTGAAVRGAEAARDAALADYDARILSALQDAEAALARFGTARTVFVISGRRVRQAEAAASLQDLRAKGGTLPRGDALEERRRAIDVRLGQIDDRANLTQSYITLTKALGLGWQPIPKNGD